IAFFRKSEIRTRYNLQLHKLCGRFYNSHQHMATRELVKIHNIFQWRREQRLKASLLVCSLLGPAAARSLRWSGPVPRTFATERFLAGVIAKIPQLALEQWPSADDERAYALQYRDMQYREPLLIIAQAALRSKISVATVADFLEASYAFGYISEESISTLENHL
ncbi:hypothetical protein V1511DRAFT_445665, partial [Dipodascopsis uninucleata]